MILIIVSFLYLNLGRDALFNWDEGIYAELGRSLLIGEGSLLTPSWNGEIWLEKPPLISWVTALGISIFGVNELGARSLMPLFAGLTLFFVYKIGQFFAGPRLGIVAMSLLASFDLFLARSRAVNTDGMLLSALTFTLYMALSKSSAFVIAFGIFFAVMSKGLAGLLVLGLILPLLFKRGLVFVARVAIFTVSLLLPWHLYQYLVNGSSFYTPYILEQVIRRATVPIEFHLESRYYYFNFLKENLQGGVLYLLILSLALLIFENIRKIQKTSYLLYWFLLPLIIFTLAKTRLYWYILPIYPAIALIIGHLFVRFDKFKLEKAMLSVFIVGLYLQSLLIISRSVEIKKTIAPIPDPVAIAKLARDYPDNSLYVLVPESERIAEAILPAEQRLSSSFRYGGAPNLVFYSQKPIIYHYNIDEWQKALSQNLGLTMLVKADLAHLPRGYVVEAIKNDYILAKGVKDALR